MYPIAPVLSFISAALPLVPLIWYLQARNIAAVAIGIWISITSFTYAVDALVWAEDVVIKAPVWCDISTSFITGSRIALPAACLSICIHLERLASFCQTTTGTSQAKQRRIIFECLMCFGLPIVYIALHLIVQPRRFDLFHGFGCRPATFPTIATIFLVLIPPLILTVATIVCAGIAWRHFLVHGVQFSGKRGSVSSLTRNLYLRLVGMALLEAVLSAVLIAVMMSRVLSSGLAPIGKMSRHLNEVLVWGSDGMTDNVWTVLQVEWSVTVVQSVVFFGLFAFRTEGIREGWDRIRSFLGLLKRLNPSAMFGREQVVSEQSFTSASVPTLPMTVVDLSVVIQSDSTLTQRGSIDKCHPATIPSLSCPPSVVENHNAPESEDTVISTIVPPGMAPLESPSRASAIASSHNSLESNFDPSLLDFGPEVWPQTPTTVPARSRLSSRSFSIGCMMPRHKAGESWFDDGWDVPPFARVKPAAHVRSYGTADAFARRPGTGKGNGVGYRAETRQAIYVTVVKETC